MNTRELTATEALMLSKVEEASKKSTVYQPDYHSWEFFNALAHDTGRITWVPEGTVYKQSAGPPYIMVDSSEFSSKIHNDLTKRRDDLLKSAECMTRTIHALAAVANKEVKKP